jgi:hypothetical protein
MPGAALMPYHLIGTEDTWAIAEDYFSPLTDVEFNRDPTKVCTGDCISVLNQMLYASRFKGFICGACAVACAVRCVFLYRRKIPNATLADFSNVVYSSWMLSTLSQRRLSHDQFLTKFRKPDFPDIINQSANTDLERGSSLGKQFVNLINSVSTDKIIPKLNVLSVPS